MMCCVGGSVCIKRDTFLTLKNFSVRSKKYLTGAQKKELTQELVMID